MMQENIKKLCEELKFNTISKLLPKLLQEALRQSKSHEELLYDLFSNELKERAHRRITKRIKEARFPLIKYLDSFDFSKSDSIQPTKINKLAEGNYINQAESIIFIGEPGTGKTHLATALGIKAIEKGIATRFITASEVCNKLIEAKTQQHLSRIIEQLSRYPLLILDELGYLPLTKEDAELLFQVISVRHEKKSLIITTNLPFSEWTSIFPDPRLCRALIDRITHRTHIIETGLISARFTEALGSIKNKN